MSTKQRCVHRSKVCCQTLKHYNNVFATGENNVGYLLVSSTNKTDRHDITEILLKAALNTIKQTNHWAVVIKRVCGRHLSLHMSVSDIILRISPSVTYIDGRNILPSVRKLITNLTVIKCLKNSQRFCLLGTKS
jgi:hypothetical protein